MAHFNFGETRPDATDVIWGYCCCCPRCKLVVVVVVVDFFVDVARMILFALAKRCEGLSTWRYKEVW